MARELDHLALPLLQAPLRRKLRGGGKTVARGNPSEHAKRLKEEAENIIRAQRRSSRQAGATPSLIFRLKLNPDGELDEKTLEKFGLTLVARDEQKTLVVFSSEEDLARFFARVGTFGSPDGYTYGEVGNIDALEPITAADRIGRRLALEPIDADATDVPVDVELWHPGTAAGALARIAELRAVVESHGGRLTDQYVGADLLVVRCRVNAQATDALLEIDYVREVDRMPEAAIERLQALGVGAGEMPMITQAPPEATGVLILDTGITANHPLLAPAMGDAQAFPAALGERDGLGAADGDQKLNGHGTAVAGFAAWGRPADALAPGPKQAEVALFSARVLDQQASYDPDLLLEHQLEDAITYFLGSYPQCRVINLSIGDARLVYPPGGRQTRLAARIDEIAYALQRRNILFVLCTGNYIHAPEDRAEHVSGYPTYLLGSAAALIEPATAALAVTVGGLSDGGAPRREAAGRRPVTANAGHPSPFTRTGFGIGGMLKPELVEAAGDFVFDPSFPSGIDAADSGVGLPSSNRDFAPPGGRLMRAVSGTSFAAPAVANMAARLFNRYPDATPNLIRALLADSALLPAERPPGLDGRHDDERVLRVFGYGRPSLERAGASEENDVLMVAEESIDADSFQLFEIPFLPRDFLALDGQRWISVSLAFDPPTRQTRGDYYLGLALQFHMFRNVALEDVSAAFRDWKRQPAGPGEAELVSSLGKLKGSQKIEFEPKAGLRARGTLQRGLKRVANSSWEYDDGPLILAVSCLRRWAPPEVTAQRFALVVSLKHSDAAARLHAPLQARLRGRPRVRIR